MELKPTAAFGIVKGEFSIVICDKCVVRISPYV